SGALSGGGLHRLESMLFIQRLCGLVLLLRVELQPVGPQRLREKNQSSTPAFAPLGGIDEHPINVGAPQREIRNDVLVTRADPDVAVRTNDVSENLAGAFER